MRSRLRKPILALPAVLAALALGACGDSHTKVTTGTYAGESGANAPYLDVGPLKSTRCSSRAQLNPANSEDSAYLAGAGAGRSKLIRARSGSACSCRSTTTPTSPSGRRKR